MRQTGEKYELFSLQIHNIKCHFCLQDRIVHFKMKHPVLNITMQLNLICIFLMA